MNQNETFKDKQARNKEPLQYALYKGVTGKFGALRLNLKKAYQDSRRDKHDGCIFLEMAPSTGPNIYDWENGKIIMALTITDIPKILLYLRAPNHPIFTKTEGKLKIYHDRGAGTNDKGKDTTTIEFNKPADKDNVFVTAYQRRGDSSKTATVTVSPDEVLALATLLQVAIPQILAWE